MRYDARTGRSLLSNKTASRYQVHSRQQCWVFANTGRFIGDLLTHGEIQKGLNTGCIITKDAFRKRIARSARQAGFFDDDCVLGDKRKASVACESKEAKRIEMTAIDYLIYVLEIMSPGNEQDQDQDQDQDQNSDQDSDVDILTL